MSRQIDCERCDRRDLEPEQVVHTRDGYACHGCVLPEAELFLKAIGAPIGFTYDEWGLQVDWDDIHRFLGGFTTSPMSMQVKTRLCTITALDLFSAQGKQGKFPEVRVVKELADGRTTTEPE